MDGWVNGVVREGAPVVLALSNASENKGCPVRREEGTLMDSVG